MTTIRDRIESREIVRLSQSPVVSVVIPAFNRSSLLAETIQSVYHQTIDEPLEIVVVDDGSEEDILAVVEANKNPLVGLQYIRQSNAGPSVARQRGAEAARGEFIQWLDSDDILDRAKLEDHVKALRVRPNTHFATGIWTRFDSDTGRVLSQHGPRYATQWPIIPCFMRFEHYSTGTALIRKSALTLFGAWPSHMHQYEDWLWWIRGGLMGALGVHVPRPGIHVRVHNGPRLTSLGGELKQAENFSTFVRSLQQLDWSRVPSCRGELAEISFDEAVKWLVVGQRLSAEEALSRALELCEDLSQRARFMFTWQILNSTSGSARLGAAYEVARSKIRGAKVRVRRRRADHFWQATSAVFMPKP